MHADLLREAFQFLEQSQHLTDSKQKENEGTQVQTQHRSVKQKTSAYVASSLVLSPFCLKTKALMWSSDVEGFDSMLQTCKLLVLEFPPESNLKIKQVKYIRSIHAFEWGRDQNQSMALY